ncbi:GGDEF domain-containing protein [Psychrobacter aquimaris]|uniref:GGDEF domain-containing protein n=1 Tax=Psychrobacter aquimaris TaxID=292733 RepID=UPI0018DEF2D2|nr:GGDEF domain-containing protein [Psychrobacter aquimaris]
MALSISHLGYNKLSQAIFEWQAADRTSLLASFMVMEVSLHWLWCLFVWWRRDVYDTYVDIGLLYPLWFGVTLVALFLLWMTTHFSPIKKNNRNLYKWQGILITVYSVYIAIVILVLGHSSLVAGVSLVGGAMLGMMLIRRRYVWRAFLGHVAIILAVTFIPYFGVTLPNLRQMTLTVVPLDTYSYINYSEMTMIENAISASIFKNGTLHWDSVNQLRRSSAFFWRSTHIYMALPKAIFIIYMFRILLLILDDSKKEILQHANQDELTQLKSRRYGLTQMKQVLKSVEDHQDISIILLDLDWFKDVNDSYGHEVGDRVLVEVAQTLLQSLTDETIVSRYGGEEFLIVLPDTTHDTAMIIAEQLRRVIAKHVITVDDSIIFSVTASLGLYTLTHDERTCIKQACETLNKKEAAQSLAKPQRIRSYSSKHGSRQTPTAQLPHDICQRLICMADKALYEAKDCGRDQVVSANEMLAENNTIAALYGT